MTLNPQSLTRNTGGDEVVELLYRLYLGILESRVLCERAERTCSSPIALKTILGSVRDELDRDEGILVQRAKQLGATVSDAIDTAVVSGRTLHETIGRGAVSCSKILMALGASAIRAAGRSDELGDQVSAKIFRSVSRSLEDMVALIEMGLDHLAVQRKAEAAEQASVEDQAVDEAGMESFPASDPPAWSLDHRSHPVTV